MTSYSLFVIIVLCLVFLPSIIAHIIRLRPVQFVKAGKVDDFCLKYCLLAIGSGNRKFKSENSIVNSSDYEIYRVHGNSMRDFGIASGQNIFVSPFKDEADKSSMSTHPVLVITISDSPKLQSQYKLRKFISYIDAGENNWDKIYEQNRDRINKITKADFISSMKKKTSSEGTKVPTVLSSTYNEHGMVYEYSLHPISSLYGTVKYVE